MDPTIFWQGSLAIPNNILLPIQAGFPRGGGANPNLLFDNFFCIQKLHENERNWTERERSSLASPWIPQCIELR